eukprot:972622_1
MNLFSSILAVLIICACLPATNASSFTEPHDHNGIVTPFKPGDPKISLDKKTLSILENGKPYQTQIQSESGGRGLVVQDVDAPTSVVWGRILDYDNYKNMAPKTIESKNYKVENVKPTKKDPLSQIIFTRLKVGFPVLKLEFFIRHLYYPELNSLTWTLDYTKKSDFNDSCGFWYVLPHPNDPDNRTRLYYSVEISMFDWVPKFVVDFMSTKALTDATGWVKKYSEQEFQKQGGKKTTESIAVTSIGNVKEVESDEKAKKNPFKKLMFWDKSDAREKKRAEEEEAMRIAEEEKRLAAEQESEARKKIFISWTRLSMVSAVCIFGAYNIHLGISQ